MKHLKTLAAALCAAAALVAVGTGTASATTACTGTETPCPSQDEISSTHDAHFKAELASTAVIETTDSVPIAECPLGTMSGDVENTGGPSETFKVSVTSLTWDLISFGCSKMSTIRVGTLEFHALPGTDNGTVTGKEQEITTEYVGVSCTYGTGLGTDLGAFTAGAPASLDIRAVLNKTAGSLLCPGTARWTANYTITEPSPMYIEP
ncbi:MAG: hypothetical protein ACTHNP_03945 [Solirubrobacterales bacterium]